MVNDREKRNRGIIEEGDEYIDENGDLVVEDEAEEFDEDDNIIELFDEDGNAVQLEHILTFECEDSFYVAFLPIEEDMPEEEQNEVIFMRLDEDENGGDVFFTIDSEEELDRVWQTFLTIYEAEEEE